MSNNSDDEKRRKRQALLRFGTDKPLCCLCGESDWRCLEMHHIAGQAHDQITAIVCRNCHRKLSDMQRDLPAGDSIDVAEKAGRLMLGMSLMFQVLHPKLAALGIELTKSNDDATGARS